LRSVSAAFQSLLEAEQATDLVTLVSIATTTPIRRALNWSTVTWQTNTYYADVGAFGTVRNSLEATRPRFELSLQNVVDAEDGTTALPWSQYLDGSLRGKEVTLSLVATSLLADSEAVIQESRWYVSGLTVDRQWIRMGLGSPHDALAFAVPRIPVGGKTCWWAYQKGPCTNREAQNGHATCGHTWNDCVKRTPVGKPAPFGPSYPFMSKQGRSAG
jgi:hypothetical protein